MTAAVTPKGRELEPGVDATYDIDTRADGEEQPQLEVSPITMYVTEYAERWGERRRETSTRGGGPSPKKKNSTHRPAAPQLPHLPRFRGAASSSV
jgi:hypothetical protein